MDQSIYIQEQLHKFIDWTNKQKVSEFNKLDVNSTPCFFDSLYKKNNVLSFFYYSEELEMYSKIYKSKIFPLTAHEDLETNFFTDEYIPSLNDRPEVVCEKIEEAYNELIHNVGFTLLNINSAAIIGLFHLFEKGCKSMIEVELRSCWFNGYDIIYDDKKSKKISEIDKDNDRWDLWLKILLDINVFNDFPNIKKLKLSANYLKHGSGDSREKLEKQFPDAFNQNDLYLVCSPLSESLGKLIYLDFDEIVEECLSFWKKIKDDFG